MAAKSKYIKFCMLIFTTLFLYTLKGFLEIIFAGQINWSGILYGFTSALCLTSTIILWDISTKSPADSHTFKTLLLQYLMGKIMIYLGKRVYKNLLQSTTHVKEVQEHILLQLLKQNKNTEYGNLMEFQSVTSRERFIEKVKLNKYINFQPYIKRMQKGEQNILVADDVVYFATTSGTTGDNKVIPITRHMKGPGAMKFGPLMYYMTDKTVGINLQRVFLLSFSARVQTTDCGLNKGPVSQHMYRYLPFVISPLEVYELTDEQLAIHVHALFALQEAEIGRVEALMSTLVYTFWVYLEHNWELVCHDIANGCISMQHLEACNDQNANHNSNILQSIIKYLKPNYNRAQELRYEFRLGFTNIANRIWPNLSCVRMLNTGGFAHHAKVLEEQHMKGVQQLSQTHAASEGFMGFDISGDANAKTYMAMIEYGFMEFIPEISIQDSEPQTSFAEQVHIGESYEIVLTTPMGLYRYRTGDVVRIQGFTNQCPVYSFQYRVGQTLNVHWEKTPESVFYDALCKTLTKIANAELVDYTTTEDVNTRSIGIQSQPIKCYILFMELKSQYKILSNEEKQMFDEELCHTFELYNSFRNSRSIGLMLVIQVSNGTFLALKAKLIVQSQNQQFKMPRVMRNPEPLAYLWERRIKKP